MKRKIVTALATAALTVGIGTAVAEPAHADIAAATSCSSNPLFASYNGEFHDLVGFVPGRGVPLVVTTGDQVAWHVIVVESGREGWMPADCVVFVS